MPTAAPDGRPLRVLAWPADANRTGNPYNALLAGTLRDLGVVVDEFTPRRLLRGGYDVWHAHWPDGALGRGSAARAVAGAAAVLALAAAARARGTRVVWTVHNLRAHDGPHPRVERAFWRGWARAVDGSLHLGASACAAALAAFPALRAAPSFVVPHPHYRGAYGPPVARADARARLGLPADARVAVYLGHIRPYKAVPALVAAFRGVADPAARLVVAGRPATAALGRAVAEAAEGDARVVLRLDVVPEADVPLVLGAADVVALPYAEVLNSGAALLALSLDRPVLVPEIGAMADLRADVGPEWVHLAPVPLTPAALAAALEAAARMPGDARAPLDAFAPAAVARGTLDAYRAVLGRTASRAERPGAERR